MKHRSLSISLNWTLISIIGLLTFAKLANASVPTALKTEANTCGPQVLKALDKKAYPSVDPKTCPVSAKLITWLKFRNDSGFTFDEIVNYINTHNKWPGQEALRARAEEALPKEVNAKIARQVLAWFAKYPPTTANGAIHYVTHLIKAGKKEEAQHALVKVWTTQELSLEEQNQVLETFKSLLSAQDHSDRCDFLLLRGKWDMVKGLLPFLNKTFKALVNARLEVQEKKVPIDQAFAAIPQKLRSNPGLIYERIKWHRQNKDFEVAAAFIHSFPHHASPLYRDAIVYERNYVARELLLMGHYREAYNLIQPHGVDTGETFSNAEWLAGWLALRFLNQPDVACEHFVHLFKNVKSPISLARGAYWAAEAKRAMEHSKEAKTWYEKAAKFQHTFYGQLALSRLKRGFDPSAFIETPQLSASFLKRPEIQVVLLLKALNRPQLTEPFLMNLLGQLKDKQEKLMLVEFARQQTKNLAYVKLAAHVTREPLPLLKAAYPILKGKSKAPLVHAVIRQESRFDAQAVSNAGAVGMMQLMPNTAKLLQTKYRIKPGSLTDVNHNIILGTKHLDEALQQYRGSLVLALARYNAGPVVDKWIQEFGDPRSEGIDPVDWIEMISWGETRNYIQRVLEGYVVYLARLGHPHEDLMTLLNGGTLNSFNES